MNYTVNAQRGHQAEVLTPLPGQSRAVFIPGILIQRDVTSPQIFLRRYAFTVPFDSLFSFTGIYGYPQIGIKNA